MKKIKFISLSILLFISFNLEQAFAQSAKSDSAANKKEDKTNKSNLVEKKYTYDEFKSAVQERVQKHLKRLGRGKIIGLSRELLKKEEQLKLREMDIEKKEETLQINSSDFEKRVKKFQGRQSKFLGCLDEMDNQRLKRVTHMVEVVSGMKPQSAAEVLSVQDTDISIKILGLLPSEKVSKIFNLMKKEISARLQKQYMTMKK